jgi:hypothetical protein
VLKRGRKGAFAATTSVENPTSCSTNPIKERSSVIFVGILYPLDLAAGKMKFLQGEGNPSVPGH